MHVILLFKVISISCVPANLEGVQGLQSWLGLQDCCFHSVLGEDPNSVQSVGHNILLTLIYQCNSTVASILRVSVMDMVKLL